MANPIHIDSALTMPPPSLPVETLHDHQELRHFLQQDRYANAYLLGYLDPMYKPFCRWYGARDEDGQLVGTLLLYQGLSIPVLFAAGHHDQLPQFLETCRTFLPRRFHFHVLEDQMEPLERLFQVRSCQRMQRMGLERAVAKLPQHDGRVERLGHRDTAAIMALYAHYPDHFFEPYQLETGLYFGVRDPKLGLVSIAGIHSVNPHDNIAVIGNLVTHPEARGQGLAKACTGALLFELFEQVSSVALNVQTDNMAAIRVYESFGFSPNNIFYEGRCQD